MTRKSVAIVLLLVLWSTLTFIIHASEAGMNGGDAKFYGSFIQLCFSSWPSQLPFDRLSWWFAIGVASRIILVLGSFVGIVAIFESMIKQRRLPMKYAEVLALRDQTIRDYLLDNLQIGDDQLKALGHFFDQAVSAADKDVEIQLVDLFGTEVATRMLQHKHETEQAVL